MSLCSKFQSQVFTMGSVMNNKPQLSLKNGLKIGLFYFVHEVQQIHSHI